MKIRKTDEVLVISGRDRGKKGKVLRAQPQDGQFLVEGVNMIKRHLKPRPTMRQAGIVEREAPIHAANVMLICTKCHQPARVGFRILEDKSKVRVCKRCHEVID